MDELEARVAQMKINYLVTSIQDCMDRMKIHTEEGSHYIVAGAFEARLEHVMEVLNEIKF